MLEAEFGPKCLTSRTLEIEKRYEPGLFAEVPLDETKILMHFAREAGCTEEELALLTDLTTTNALYNRLSELGDGLPPSLIKVRQRIADLPDQSLKLALFSIIKLPKIMYFSNYDRMSGDVSVEKLRADIRNDTISDSDRVFMNFLRFAGTNLDALANSTRYEQLTALAEAASIKITDQIFEYWSQNQQLKVKIDDRRSKIGGSRAL